MPANMCMHLTDPRKRWYKVEPCQARFRRECARREAYETDLQGAHQMFWLHVYSRTSLLEADSATDLTLCSDRKGSMNWQSANRLMNGFVNTIQPPGDAANRWPLCGKAEG